MQGHKAVAQLSQGVATKVAPRRSASTRNDENSAGAGVSLHVEEDSNLHPVIPGGMRSPERMAAPRVHICARNLAGWIPGFLSTVRCSRFSPRTRIPSGSAHGEHQRVVVIADDSFDASFWSGWGASSVPTALPL